MKILFARRVEERRLSYLRSTPLIVNLLNARLSTPGGGGNWHNHRLASGRRHFRVYYLSLGTVALPTQVANICANPVVGMCLLNSELDGPADISDSRLAWKSPLSHHLLVSVSAHVPLVKIHGHRVKCYIFVVRTSADFDRGSRIFFKILRSAFRFWRDTFCVSYL